MSVTFMSKQSGISVSHEHLFHCGAIIVPTKEGTQIIEVGSDKRAAHILVPDVEKMREMGIPAPTKYGRNYEFTGGEDHNLLILDTDEEIEAMRAYIEQRNDDLIEEV